MSKSSEARQILELDPLTDTAKVSSVAEHEKNLEALSALLCQFGQPTPPSDFLSTLVATISKQFEGVLAEIWEEEKGSGEFVRRAVQCEARLSVQREVSQISRHYAARLRGLSGAYRGSPFPELPPEFMGSPPPPLLLAQPIQLGGKNVGLLTLYRATEADSPALPWFRAFADLAALAFDRSRLAEENEKTIRRLRSVLAASKMLHSTLDLDELLQLIVKLATSEIDADRGTLYLVDQSARELWSVVALGLERQEIRLPFGRGVAGHVAETGKILNISNAYQDPFFDRSFDQRFDYRTRSLLCLPIRNNRGEMLGVLELINKRDGEFQQGDVDILGTFCVHMALALENAQRHRELLAKQRMEKELVLARGLQRSLLPAGPPLLYGYDLAVLHEPCFEVGGDYYDFLSLGSNTVLLVVADVEGKGVSSALIMSNLQATLRALVLNLHSLEVIIRSLNAVIRENTKSQKFLSIFLGLIDTRGHGLHYINAGHVPPIVVRTSDEVISLTSGGTVIGLFDSAQYTRGKVELLPGDVLLFCTDGIVEASGPTGEQYGTGRLIELVRNNRRRTAQDVVELISKEIQEFSRDGLHTDDRVLLVMKVQETARG